MNKIMLLYPPGKAYQRSEDRAQCNLDDSAVATVHACNDIGYAASILRNRGYNVFLRDYQTERTEIEEVKTDILSFNPDIIVISTTNATILTDIEFTEWIHTFCDCQFILKGAIFFNISEEILKILLTISTK